MFRGGCFSARCEDLGRICQANPKLLTGKRVDLLKTLRLCEPIMQYRKARMRITSFSSKPIRSCTGPFAIFPSFHAVFPFVIKPWASKLAAISER
jgi:hypothetical protein